MKGSLSSLDALRTRILNYEQTSRQLDTAPPEFSGWMNQLRDFTGDFLNGLDNEPAYQDVTERPGLSRQIPVQPETLETVLEEFCKVVLNYGIHPTSGRFFGYVPGGGLPTAAVGDFLAAITNRYAGVYQASPGAAEVENLTIQWLLNLIGFPSQAWGTLQSGGTLATLTAVVAARQTRPFERWAKGVIYYTEEIHNAVLKSLHIAGLSHVPRRVVDVDSEYRMSCEALERLIVKDERRGLRPWMVFSSAGTVNTGAVDPLEEIAWVCQNHGLWLHVDAAYGGFFILTESGQRLLSGMADADSLVLDPHKGLFLPYGCGAVLVKQGHLLKQAFTFHSDYLADVLDHNVSSPADYSPELTRHFRGLRLWMSLKLHGLARFQAALEEKLALAEYAYQRLANLEKVELGPIPQLSCVTFRLREGNQDGDGATSRLRQTLLSQGRVHLSSTRLQGKLYLRMCILCFRSHLEEVETALEEIQRFCSTL